MAFPPCLPIPASFGETGNDQISSLEIMTLLGTESFFTLHTQMAVYQPCNWYFWHFHTVYDSVTHAAWICELPHNCRACLVAYSLAGQVLGNLHACVGYA